MNYWSGKLVLILILFSASNIFPQNFSGKIVDNNSNPIAGSTVLIKEANQGLACTDEGEFQITLPLGTYSVEYRSMGYESHSEKITIKSNEKIRRNITLAEKPFLS